MAGDKEQGKKGAGGKEVAAAAKDEKPKAINLDDHYSIKRVLDDAVSEVVLGRGYVENYIIFTREKSHILFTYAFPGSFSSTGLAISSKLPRYSDIYTLTIASADPQSIGAHPPVEITKSVTKWFTKGGVLLEDLFFCDVEKLLDDYSVDPKETRTRCESVDTVQDTRTAYEMYPLLRTRTEFVQS
ncbi:unnamed protein product [Calypogeia fissa]